MNDETLTCMELTGTTVDIPMQGSPEARPHPFWRDYLRGAPALLELPVDLSRPAVLSARTDRVSFCLNAALVERLRKFAGRCECGDASVISLTWAIVLTRISGQQDFVLGVRRRDATNANIAPLRIRVSDELQVLDLLRAVDRDMAKSREHEVPLRDIVAHCDVTAAPSYAPLVQVVIDLNEAGGSIESWGAPADLLISLGQGPAETFGTIRYATNLFERSTVERWISHFDAALSAILDDSQLAVGCVPLMDDVERRRILKAFNATQAAYPKERLVHQLFEQQVEQVPDAIAVKFENDSLTYAELNALANRLAWFLTDKGVRGGDYVPILMPRSTAMLIAQIAVLKCGAVYVPIDPEFPAQRRAFMIDDCGGRLVVGEAAAPADIRMAADVQWLDCAAAAEAIGRQPTNNLTVTASATAPAYVMYTSGSTGTPKGVVVPHHAVNRLVINNGYARIEPIDCIPHYSNPAFDASVFEIWGPLLNGARVLIISQAVVLDASRFAAVLLKERVSLLWITVGLFNQYTSALAPVFRQLRYVIVGGDVLDPGAVRTALRDSPPQHLLNAYGPTECATFSTMHEIRAVEPARSIPIGRPIANGQIYILDRRRQPVPIGVAGEIYIGGEGVASGYLNRPQLTAERFVPDTFTDEASGRLYKTGDLGRWSAQGVIEFLGRNDRQVKIRGFRIELGEIEAQLTSHSQLDEALVIAQEESPGVKRLVAYVVPKDMAAHPAVEELRTRLQAALPQYMVPSAFVTLKRMPLNSTGKVDRHALPAPDAQAYVSRTYEAPQGEKEELLARIWRALLCVERVGRQDNFFELGGHSLLIVQLMDQLRQLGWFAQVDKIYALPTLAGLAGVLMEEAGEPQTSAPNLIPPHCRAITPEMLPLVELDALQIERIVNAVPGGAVNVQDIYPLTPLQEGILFHHVLDQGGTDTYVLRTLLRVESKQRLDALIEAIQVVINRHDVLRTAILWDGLPQPMQVVYRHAPLPVEEVQLLPGSDTQQQVRGWIKPERSNFDLRQAPLIRLRIAADPLSAAWFVMFLTHHIGIDHVTEEIAISEVVACLSGQTAQLPDVAPYRNHVIEALAHARRNDAEAFFSRKLGDVDEPTLAFGLSDVQLDGTHIDEAHEDVDLALASRIRTQARRLGVTPATLFHAAWGLLIARTSGRDDVVFGSVLLGRLQGNAGAQRIIGLFINTLPVRLRIGEVTALQLVQHTQNELVELMRYEQASLAVAQRCSGLGAAAPLFNALLNYVHAAPGQDAQWSAAVGVELITAQERTNYPLTMLVEDSGVGFRLRAMTDPRVAPQRLIGNLRTAVDALSQALEKSPDCRAITLQILPTDEQREVIETFNHGQDCPQESLIHELFQQRASAAPGAIAITYDGQSLTYGELNARANQVAHHLHSLGAGPDQLVGVCVDRSLDMVVALLAVLKAGAAYVPLDPNYPPERLAHILEDSQPRVLLIQECLRDRVPLTTAEIVSLDSERASSIHAGANLDAGAMGLRPHHLAYVIYTSGSTGKPKGVMVSHRNVTRLFAATDRWFSFGAQDVWTLFHSFAFDFSVWELWGALLYGGRVVVVPHLTTRSADDFYRLVCEEGVTVLNQTPSAFAQFIDAQGRDARGLKHELRTVIFGGEALELRMLRPWVHRNGDEQPQLVNMYGITETTVHVTYRRLTRTDIDSERGSLIGRPIPDLRVYLLDAHRQPVPVGAVGEMYVSGAGVARGYLNRDELTRERFLPDPFANERADAHMYKSGDLGRWRADGTLEYLGRNDEQVKVRGFRIELGEIQNALSRHPAVKEVLVLAREDVPGQKRLVAYVVAKDATAPPSAPQLRAHVKTMLPEYMVPGAFVDIDRVPLTVNGKLDRAALPVPDAGACADREYEAPQGEVEELLAQTWQELLQIRRVGRADNFFDLGGHSILAMRLVARIKACFSVDVPMKWLFQLPSLKELAVQIEEERRARLLRAVTDGSADIEALLERVAAMSESQVHELLRGPHTEERL